MNATTTTTIAGERRELVIGRRYVLAHRNGAAHEVILAGRRPNGDLLINRDDADQSVKVRDVVSLTAVPDDVADVESDAGQQALETAYQVARTARRMSVRSLDEGRPVRRSASAMLESLGTEAGVLGVLDELVSGARHQTKRERMRDLAIAGTAAAKLEVEHHPDAPLDILADDAERLAAKRAPATEKPARSPRKARAVSTPAAAPVRHKNRLWRCPVCKVRTRLETCPRDATPAPAGKRSVAS